LNELEYLLNLDGEIFPLDNGYWVKFEAKRTETSNKVPHGIRYSLTLHDKRNHRVIGYDNAHSYKPTSKKYGVKKETYDHIHKKTEIFPFEFENAGQLMEDFWSSVNRYIDEN
jgi:hypothetical protein